MFVKSPADFASIRSVLPPCFGFTTMSTGIFTELLTPCFALILLLREYSPGLNFRGSSGADYLFEYPRDRNHSSISASCLFS